MNKFLLGLMASAAIAIPAVAQTTPPGPQTEQSQPPSAAPSQGDMSPQSLSREQVMELQNALKAKGYDVGPADGVWGPNTASALRSFQDKQGLSGGQLNSQTLSALGIDSTRYGNPQQNNPGSQPPSVAPGAPPSSTQPGQPGAPSDPSSPGAPSDPNRGSMQPDQRAPGASPTPPTTPGKSPGAPSGPTR
jgi:peptidoglycan hydrolase-like protein with peptidoglycan-binding domain